MYPPSAAPGAANRDALPSRAEDDAVFERCLAFVREQAAGEVEGVYGPSSATWRIWREPVVGLAGLRAILLQLAHPAVATGVEHYSGYREDAWGRARRTAEMSYQFTFGDLETALWAARRLHSMHHRVRGRVDPATGAAAPHPLYRANDPDLLLWVYATLVDSTVVLYEALGQPLPLALRHQLYEEGRRGAALVGIPPEQLPPTLTAFEAYVEGMLAGGALTVGPVARAQAAALFDTPYLPSRSLRLLTMGLLPRALREAFGYPWAERHARACRALLEAVRLTQRVIPAEARAVPAYHQAVCRVARARGQRPPGWSRLAYGLARRYVPFLAFQRAAARLHR